MEVNNSTLNNCACGRWDFTDEDETFLLQHGWWVQNFTSGLVGILGLFVNIIGIVVLSDRKMKKVFFNQLLICLAVFDIVFLICCLNDSFRRHIVRRCDHEEHQKYLLLVFYPARQIAMFGSIYMTMIIAYERYTALATLFSNETSTFGFSGKRRALKIVSMVVLGSFVYNFPWFLAFGIKQERILHNSTYPFKEEILENTTSSPLNAIKNCFAPTDFRSSKDFVLWYVNVANFVVTGVIPFLCLVVFNWKIITKIRHLSKERNILDIIGTVSSSNGNQRKNQKVQEGRRAVIMFVIVIAFLFLHSLRSILNIEEIWSYEEREKTMETAKHIGKMCRGDQFWYVMATVYSHLLLVLNSSINFFVYCLFGKQFRDIMKEKMRYVTKLFRSCKKDGKDKQNVTEMPVVKP